MPDELDPQTDAALDIVARHFVRQAMERFAGDAWEHYPEIGQDMFDEVETRAMKIVGEWPDKQKYQVAYDHLEQLAETWAQEHPGEIG